MNKKLSSLILSFAIIALVFYSCKKDDRPIEKRITGTWQLDKITFIETNASYPLDSFRNVFNVNLTLNSDSSFNETEEIGSIYLGPWNDSNTPIAEYYHSPRNAKARYLISKNNYVLNTNSRNFSIKQDSLIFKVSYTYGSFGSIMEQVYSRKFSLKNNNELDIERLDLIVFNKESGATLNEKLKFSYRRK